MRTNRSVALSALLLLAVCAAYGQSGVRRTKGVEISLDVNRVKGLASNQYAIWIENERGEYVKTIFVTRFTATKGWRTRPEALPGWTKASRVASMPKAIVDSVSGATPRTGRRAYSWDYTDEGERRVPDGKYYVVIEGSIRWANEVVYRAQVAPGGDGGEIEAAFRVTGGTDEEKGMIANVVMRYAK